MKNIPAIIVAIVTLIVMAYIGKEGYLAAKNYERTTFALTEKMDMESLAESQLKELASKLSLGLYTNDIKAKITKLRERRELYDRRAKRYALYFALCAVVLLSLFFFLSVRGFTIVVASGALVALVNGLITPIMMLTVHKEVAYLGDVVLSFESKGILGTLGKLYGEGSVVVAVALLIFSVLLPALKTLAMLFVAIYEERPSAAKVVAFFKHLGKWSMVDVFVVALLLVFLSSNNSDVSRAELQIGLYFFLIYVLLSMVSSLSADKMLHEKGGR